MKYFMSVYSPHRGRQRNFVMSLESARHYYREWSSNVLEAKVMFRRGGKLYGSGDLYIWGENIPDQEIFKRQLAGTVDQETWER